MKNYNFNGNLLEEELMIRMATAIIGYPEHLNILVSDPDPLIRSEVAKHGREKDLDILVYDYNPYVRFVVAHQGIEKYLDILIDDDNASVRDEVLSFNIPRHLAKFGMDVNDNITILDNYRNNEQRESYDLDILINDKSPYIRHAVAMLGMDKDLDILVNDSNFNVRRIVALRGRDVDLDKLVYDEHYAVRVEVAKHGRQKDLDILVNDVCSAVREEVALHGHREHLAILRNDKNESVRAAVYRSSIIHGPVRWSHSVYSKKNSRNTMSFNSLGDFDAGANFIINSDDENNETLGFFTSFKVIRDTVPTGFFVYDVRFDDNGKLASIEHFVSNNYAGSFVTQTPIIMNEHGYYDISNPNSYTFDR